MKLYGTITSERASKGQGGNTALTMTLYGENKKPVGDIIFSHCEHTKPCHEPRYLADVRIFHKEMIARVYDYPAKELPPYLAEKGEKQ
jgi:hypothetical protein